MLKRFLGALMAAMVTAGAAQAATITLYSEPGFRGDRITLRHDIGNFAEVPPWNDRARSLIVESGSWEVCKNAGFDKCRTLTPGTKIAHLGEIKYLGEISSLRLLDNYARDDRWDRDDRWNDRRWDDDRWGRQPQPRPPVNRPPPRWDDDVVWDNPRRPTPVNNLTACQRSVYDGFLDRYGRHGKVEFSGGGRDGTVWWNGEPWRYRCTPDRINIWQEGRW
ncbi:beta/gamma crystallin-related protein [Indioceanicola profundi]|uniref:beta/gamma crystallin-related protein n=1 Tax=Indioceanicola profundi TaxID=2220096 RepID=UPI0013C43606|nr:beta/gamma crystallin-related protein [Indioceanicola profundi]